MPVTTKTTSQNFSGTGSQTAFQFTIEYDSTKTSDLKVEVNDVLQTETTHYSISGATLTFVSAPAAGTNNIRIYRSTSLDSAGAVFAAGSSIRATDLNSNQDQFLFAAQELQNDQLQDTVGATPPSGPFNGQRWYNTTNGRTYVWYIDVDTSQWVEASPPFNTDGSGFYSHGFTELTGTTFGVTQTYHQVVPSSGSTTYALTTITGGKIGQKLTISGPPAWRASTSYAVGDIVHNDSGKYYKCDRAGTSHSSGGPTGTSADIEDDGAAPDARWDYIGQAGDIVLTNTTDGGTLNGIVGGVTIDVSEGDTATLLFNGYQWLLISHGNN